MISVIKKEDLRKMKEQEGLILQGCGGEPKEWLDGVNDLFTQEKILQNGSKFENCSVFSNDGLTCILFPFDGVDLDIGKLAIWRIATHGNFGGTWLSDYVPNRLGGFQEEQKAMEKPDCPLIGQDGNMFNLLGIASRTLREHGMGEQAKEMSNRIMTSGVDYNGALNIIGEYVNITDGSGQSMEDIAL
ncbi:MAG: hypothetical protein IJB34_08215 [Clostridia bacterium]|nr:hypothetical protein [Clostridia bacterium]